MFVAAARIMGYPARYVSGYLMMNDRVHQDASHAWAEAHIDGVGWVGFERLQRHLSGRALRARGHGGSTTARAAPVSGLRFGAGGEALSIGHTGGSSSSVAADNADAGAEGRRE